jgi:EAL domain-containing protein (putative c-di-GMP-specific phosphodiesterase class I)
MDKFHKTGFRLLLDDFGNGYSSLATLNTMNFDILKLDKSLIDYIGDYKGEVLLRHTIELAKKFGLNITAEGVETKEQVNFLQEVKCDDIQGYYFSKPLPKAEFERLMQSA